eukprot:7550329-Pyramimonas_sp.AAC.1
MRSPGHQPRSSQRENNKLTTDRPSSDTCHSALGAIPVCPTAVRSGKEREAACRSGTLMAGSLGHEIKSAGLSGSS